MATLKPLYGSKTAITISLDSLADGSTVTSSAIDNSTNRYQDFLIQVVIAGTGTTTAWCEVRLAPSLDGTNFADWDNAIPIGIIALPASPRRGIFSLSNALFQAPEGFKIIVKNNTGAALSGSGNSADYQGIQEQSV